METEIAALYAAFEGGPPGDPNTIFIPGGAWHDFVKNHWTQLLAAIAAGPGGTTNLQPVLDAIAASETNVLAAINANTAAVNAVASKLASLTLKAAW